MDYHITQVSEQLLFIKWHNDPADASVETRFLAELEAIMDRAKAPLYVISDLRKGRINSVMTLRKLGALGRHPNFAGGTAFSTDMNTSAFTRLFARFSGKDDPLWDTPEQALQYLESQQPGITQGIDWPALLAGGE